MRIIKKNDSISSKFLKYFHKSHNELIPLITLSRIVLRPFKLNDAKRVQFLAGDISIVSGAINIPYPYLDGIAESWISTHYKEYKKGNSLILAITLKESGLLIGSVGLYVNKIHQNAELGYWIGKDYWGNGYCSEAVSGIINYAFTHMNLNKIFANFLTRNSASGRVLIKNGFCKEGFFKKHIKYADSFEDVECYSLLKEDYSLSAKNT